ncbi:MAG: dihydroorotate dehydrogenase electron transfer subunit [Atribacterota bacterium]|nr:dihydroorotate dehydrogenase electron transfer subunit [Atribacterota bacterium]
MALVSFNKPLKNNYYLLKIAGKYHAQIGQFFMIRKNSQEMFLSRPMSVYDLEEDGVTFLYCINGKGTAVLAKCRIGDEITINGPYGNGFPTNISGNLALVGGGTGIAPLFYALKKLQGNPEVKNIDVFLGLQQKNVFESYFQKLSNLLEINYGGYITDYIPYQKYNIIFSCGPEIMMRKIEEKARNYNIKHYLSLEKRMACGVGACLVCSCQTKNGNARACKDGPVFLGKDIFYE